MKDLELVEEDFENSVTSSMHQEFGSGVQYHQENSKRRISAAAAASSSPSSLQAPMFVEIVEQPASKGLRFRYECEGRSAGSIPGVHSTCDNKTFPTIKVQGYKGRAVVVVSCVSVDTPYRPHPHSLIGKEGCKKGVCTLEIDPSSMTCGFPSLGIQCVKRKEIEAALTLRQQIRVDPFQTGFAHKDNIQSIDLNSVRLCFQVFLEGSEKGAFTYALRPVVSDPIFDKKSRSDLTICRMTECSASVSGGKEIMLFCDKVNKDDIQVQFFEESGSTVVWKAMGDFQATDVHKQYGICLKTPKYKNLEVTEAVKAFIQLYRPSDGVTSQPRNFYFTPLDGPIHGAKRFKTENLSEMLLDTSCMQLFTQQHQQPLLMPAAINSGVAPAPQQTIQMGQPTFQQLFQNTSLAAAGLAPVPASTAAAAAADSLPTPPTTAQPIVHFPNTTSVNVAAQLQMNPATNVLQLQQQQQQLKQQPSVPEPAAPSTPEVARAFVAMPKPADMLLTPPEESANRKVNLKRQSPSQVPSQSAAAAAATSIPSTPVSFICPASAPSCEQPPAIEIKEEVEEVSQHNEEDNLSNNQNAAAVDLDLSTDLPTDGKEFDIGELYDDVMQCVYDDVASTGGDLGQIFSGNDEPPAPPERIRTANGNATTVGMEGVAASGGGGGGMSLERPLPQKPPKSHSVIAKFTGGAKKGKGKKGGKEEAAVSTAVAAMAAAPSNEAMTSASNNPNKTVETTNNKKNASLFARFFNRSKSHEDANSKIATTSLDSKSKQIVEEDMQQQPPCVPEHKTAAAVTITAQIDPPATNEDSIDLFDIIDKDVLDAATKD